MPRLPISRHAILGVPLCALAVLAAFATPIPIRATAGPPATLHRSHAFTPQPIGGATATTWTVPAGKAWRIDHYSTLAEKFQGPLPLGGEFTVGFHSDIGPNASPPVFLTILHQSSLETNNRIALQGHGYTGGLVLPAGKSLRLVYFLRPGQIGGDFFGYGGITGVESDAP